MAGSKTNFDSIMDELPPVENSSVYPRAQDGGPRVHTREIGRPRVQRLRVPRVTRKTGPRRRDQVGPRHRDPQLNTEIDPQLFQWIKDYCEQTGCTVRRYIEALTRVHQQSDPRVQNGGDPRVHNDVVTRICLGLDDLKIINTLTNESIINAYRKITNNRWKATDDEVGKAYNLIDPRLVEIAIIETSLRSKSKINSFAYFKSEIDFLIDSKPSSENLDVVLKRRREMWAEMKGDQ